MSDRLLVRIWKDVPLRAAQRTVLLSIAQCATERGSCAVPIRTIAALSDLAPSTTFAAIAALRRGGWLISRRSFGQGRFSAYQLNLTKLENSRRCVRSELERAVSLTKARTTIGAK